jgi:hypothetical protein
MSSELLTVRFPSGETEFRLSDSSPEPGDVLTRNGDSWIVDEIIPSAAGATVVVLRPEPKPAKPIDKTAPAA